MFVEVKKDFGLCVLAMKGIDEGAVETNERNGILQKKIKEKIKTHT